MSRPIANPGLRKLCAKITGPYNPNGITINDLANMVDEDSQPVRAIHLYSTGRRHFPILESKLAKIFKLSVPQLRKKLGLPAIKGGKK